MSLSRVRLLTAVFAIVLMPSPAHLVLVEDPRPFFAVAVRLADVPLALLIALAAPLALARLRALGILGGLTAAFVALVVLSLLVHPSPHGLQTLFRVMSAIALVLALLDARLDRERRFVLVALALTALTQTALAVAQVAYGDLLVAYEHPPVFEAGPFIRPAGTMANGFVLAGLALVAAAALAVRALSPRASIAWVAVAALAIVPVGISFSRAAALGGLLLVAALVPGALRLLRQRAVLAALLVGLALPALVTLEGWITREAQHSTGDSAGTRVELATQAWPLLARDPLLGVGPGRTMQELRRLQMETPGAIRDDRFLEPPHSLPLVIGLEAGIPAGLVSVALLALVGVRAVRSGPAAVMAYAGLLPYTALDNYLWTAPTGPTLLALWTWAALGGPRAHERSAGPSLD